MSKIRKLDIFINLLVSVATAIICKCYYTFESGICHPVVNEKKQFLDYLVIQT